MNTVSLPIRYRGLDANEMEYDGSGDKSDLTATIMCSIFTGVCMAFAIGTGVGAIVSKNPKMFTVTGLTLGFAGVGAYGVAYNAKKL